MTSSSRYNHLISPLIQVSDTSVPLLKKNRLRFIHTLNIQVVEPSLLNNLKSCIKHTKRIRTLNTGCPSKRLNDAIASSLKGLQRLYVVKDQDSTLNPKTIKTMHRRLSTLQFYRGAYKLQEIPIFRSLREVQELEVKIKEKSGFKPIKLETLGAKTRYIHGMKRLGVMTLRTTLADFLDLMERLPRTKRFKLRSFELDLPKDVDKLNLSLLSKIEGLEVNSASKGFVEFFAKNIDRFENLDSLQLSQNGPTILKLNEFKDYALFSRFSHLESLKFIKLYFRFPFPATPQSLAFFDELRLPKNLTKLSLNFANVSLNQEKGYIASSSFGRIFKQIEGFKQLTSLHLNIDLAREAENDLDSFLRVLPLNLPNLKAIFLDFFSGAEFIAVNLAEIFKWASTHKNLEYLHLTMPGIKYQGFDSSELQNLTFEKLRIMHVMSSNRNYFSRKGFGDFLKFVSGIKELRTLHFNCWGSDCTPADIQDVADYVVKLEKLENLTFSVDAQNVDYEEFLVFKEILKSLKSLRYLYLFIRKRGYDLPLEITQRFENEFSDEKNRMKNSLGFYVNQQTLL